MSGGAFDYRDHTLFDLRDSVAREIGYYENSCDEDCAPKDSNTLKYMKQICKDLYKLGKVLHSLDWYLSGDTGEDDFIKDYESIYNKENK